MRDNNFDIQENMQLFKTVYDDQEVCSLVMDYIDKDYSNVKRFAKFLIKNKWRKLVDKQPLLILSSIALSLKTAQLRFIDRGFDEQVFFDTMSDIKVWGEDYRKKFNKVGLTEINWIRLHINCLIFKIGRLQYQIGRYYFSPKTVTGNKKISLGEKCYFIHIQRGGKLERQDCIQSINLAAQFLKKIFPKIRTDVMTCHSWLLSSKNKNFVEPSSNIAQFAALFENVGETQPASGHFRWIFGIEEKEKTLKQNKESMGIYLNLSDFQPKNIMQTNAKNYIMNGGDLTDGKGIILIDSVCQNDKSNYKDDNI